MVNAEVKADGVRALGAELGGNRLAAFKEAKARRLRDCLGQVHTCLDRVAEAPDARSLRDRHPELAHGRRVRRSRCGGEQPDPGQNQPLLIPGAHAILLARWGRPCWTS